MEERRRYRIANFRRLVDERSQELAFYEAGVRVCEGRNGRLVDVTDDTVARLKVERAWYEEQAARIEREA